VAIVKSKRVLALVTATVFMAGTVSVCLHGPDDQHASCGGHDHFHMTGQDSPGDDHHDVGAHGPSVSCDSHFPSGDNHSDIHMCPCVSHIQCDSIAGNPVPTGQIVSMRPLEDPVPMPSGFSDLPYRPPVC